jgi:hypothetical protein
MRRCEKLLRIMMRLFGASSLLALPFVFVPRSLMATIHQDWLAMGPLPEAPIVGYLARSTSAFYALVGGLMIVLSLDISRYRPVIGYLLGASLAFACMLLGIDLAEGMPRWWALAEGPFVMVITSTLLVVWWRVGNGGDQASHEGADCG